jgi:predicted RNA binding protein YcfA (HicA-like mRNA interferase family)
MRLPRDVSGREFAKRLHVLGYSITRQKGSHLRLTTTQDGEHHVTIPDHSPLRIGTLRSVLGDVASHFGMTCEQLVDQLFGSGS